LASKLPRRHTLPQAITGPSSAAITWWPAQQRGRVRRSPKMVWDASQPELDQSCRVLTASGDTRPLGLSPPFPSAPILFGGEYRTAADSSGRATAPRFVRAGGVSPFLRPRHRRPGIAEQWAPPASSATGDGAVRTTTRAATVRLIAGPAPGCSAIPGGGRSMPVLQIAALRHDPVFLASPRALSRNVRRGQRGAPESTENDRGGGRAAEAARSFGPAVQRAFRAVPQHWAPAGSSAAPIEQRAVEGFSSICCSATRRTRRGDYKPDDLHRTMTRNRNDLAFTRYRPQPAGLRFWRLEHMPPSSLSE